MFICSLAPSVQNFFDKKSFTFGYHLREIGMMVFIYLFVKLNENIYYAAIIIKQ